MNDHSSRLCLARDSLEGLSVGDALGEALSYRFHKAREHADFSAFRDGTVRYTDDTEMALGIFEMLDRVQTIDQEVLAWMFAKRFEADPLRGYGRMARRILGDIALGANWRSVSSAAFGAGSFGNGAAMRVAPLGAYFGGNLDVVSKMARRSAEVTHYHPEGIAGAIAVAVGAAVAAQSRERAHHIAAEAIWDAVIDLTPESEVRHRLVTARKLQTDDPRKAARELGNGAEISAQDTVPFCLWSACRNLGNFTEAFFNTIKVGGDCDTNCAIVGGVVCAFTGTEGIPAEWVRIREPLGMDL